MTYERSSDILNESSGDWISNWFDVKLIMTSSSAEDGGNPSIWGLKKNRKRRLDKKFIYIWLIYFLKKFGGKIGNINVAVNDLTLCFNAK
jgi:hypothetical protein